MKQLSIVLLALACVVPATAGASRDVASFDPDGVRLLQAASGGSATLRTHPVTGAARFVRVEPGSLPLAGATPEVRAAEFLARHGRVLGVRDAGAELSAPHVRVDRFGATRVSYTQTHRGVPVFAGVLRVHFDAAGRMTAANGTFVPDLEVDTRPGWTSREAARVALADLESRSGLSHAFPVEARSTRLLVFRAGLVQRVPGRDHLAWEIEIGNGHDVRELVFVDAHTGKVVDRIDGIQHVLDRKIHEGELDSIILWSEGDAQPYDSGDPANDDQVNGLIDTAAGVYDLYSRLSGASHLSWDGASGTMHSVWKSTSIPCPNASWNGTSTNFCDGVASDDVVAHEWAHAYTQATHGLIYQWQPGALNEAYSDIYGEVIDLINGTGTDSPSTTRTAGDCSTFGGGLPPSLEILAPPVIAGSYAAAGAAFNPAPPISATGAIELVNDGGGASVTDACESLVGFTSGAIALIDRGNCSFISKLERAQNAGAIGAIIVNYNNGTFQMSGSGASITIPSVMVGSNDGQAIEDELGAGVNGTISLQAAGANSVRWLMGEDSFSFGGAIRDMWNPSCFGDPDRVTDFRYHCSTSDGGGVHTNSAVPNHAFALLVDGGSFNGQTVAALGLNKAAHLYWRAMSVYQVPDTDFADHADALAQSCSDLIGVALTDLSGAGGPVPGLTAFDCTQVANAMLAVEMVQSPPCAFEPLLDPATPQLACGAVNFFDDFEEDPTPDWTRSNVGVFAEYDPRDWEWTYDLPAGGSGAAFFAIDSLEIGNCLEGDDDQSGMMSLDSPAIVLGGEATVAFDHWVATEALFDGGNLKLSVNGGPYVQIDGSSFLFNPYNDTLRSSGDGNTNPMAGEDAFTGSDGGEVTGSWGQSQIDLSALADPGDTIRLRLDLGVDGCNGLCGWYVDNVLVCSDENGAGWVPNGASVGGTWLTLDKVGTDIRLSWGASCVGSDGEYEIYEGALGDFASHESRFCDTGGLTTKSFEPEDENRYYLVVPRSTDREGSYGTDSEGDERPQSADPCLPQALKRSCD